MKRGAEKQISKDDGYDDEGQEDSPQTGFKKADEDALSRRKIRALPKRALGGAASTSSLQPETSTNKFTGFSFGESSSFTSPPAAISTAATNTAKTLSSFLATSSASLAPTFTPSVPLFNPPLTSSPFSAATSTTTAQSSATHALQKDGTPDPAELKFFTSLRGLNESLRASIQKAVDDDPFVDISIFLERYKTLRADIQKDFDARSTSKNSTTATTAAPPTKTFSMPTPPSTGFSFSVASPSTSETKTTLSGLGSGFIPSTTVPSDGFAFGKPAEPKLNDPATSKSSTGFSFGTASGSNQQPDAPTFSLPYSFGAKSSEGNEKDISGSVLFSGFGKPTTTTTTTFASSSPFTFGNSSGGSPSTTSPFGATATPSFTKPDSSSFTFGAPKSTGAFGFDSNVNPSGDKDKVKTDNTFTFGSSSTATTPASSFSFGGGGGGGNTLSDSNSKPSRFAGFAGFGKPPTPGSTSIGFSFGGASSSPTTPGTASTPTTAKSDSGEGTSGEANDDAPKRSAAENFLLNADNKHDQEGAGEEDEETAHAVKLKAYVLKDDKGTKSWVELGYGVLRIKKHKESGSRRILLRSSSTGQILINFAFHSAFNPTLKNKNISFMGHDPQRNSKMYTLKLQTEQQATELKEAFDREIKAKDES